MKHLARIGSGGRPTGRPLILLLLLMALAVPAAAGSSGTPDSVCGVNCEGGGPSCTWYGTVPAHAVFVPCVQGVWRYADVSTTGCCTGGSSFTYFWYGNSDVRFNNVSGLRVYAANPNSVEQFVLQNSSNAGVWYWVHQQ